MYFVENIFFFFLKRGYVEKVVEIREVKRWLYLWEVGIWDWVRIREEVMNSGVWIILILELIEFVDELNVRYEEWLFYDGFKNV